MKLVRVRWWDAITHKAGWKSLRKAGRLDPPLCTSVGFIVKKTRKKLTLAASLSGDGDCDGDVVIPRGMIKSIRKLKVKP